MTLDQRLQWFGTLRGRVGVLATPNVLLYVTGGLAYGEIKTDVAFTATGVGGFVTAVALSQRDTKSGVTVGGGIEGRLWGNWSGKLEYIYLDLGSVGGTIINTPAGIGASWASTRFKDNILRAGINYRFYDPVVAKF